MICSREWITIALSHTGSTFNCSPDRLHLFQFDFELIDLTHNRFALGAQRPAAKLRDQRTKPFDLFALSGDGCACLHLGPCN